jgi:putative peptidoglycan lipid II flippase
MIATKNALLAFNAGLPAFLMVKIFAPGFYANHDTKTPFKIAIACVLINLFFNLTLSGPFRHVGMAMATSIAGWVNVAAMGWILHKRGLFAPDRLLKTRLVKLCGAAALMMFVLILADGYFAEYYRDGALMKTVALSTTIALGAAVYGVAVLGLRAYDASTLTRFFKRKRAA